MKNRLSKTLSFLLAAALVGVLTVGLVACNKTELTGISVENPRTEFNEGDEFTVGDAFKVIAHYGDGSTADVTADVQIRHEAGFDMNVAGDYMVTVSYGNKKEVYTVRVGSCEKILKKIEIDSSSVKKNYCVGDEISYGGIKINCTYENAQGDLEVLSHTGLSGFTVTVDGPSQLSDGVFMALGEYTVTVSKNGLRASYKVLADGVNIASVQGAIFTGSAFKGNVVSGSSSIREGLYDKTLNEAFAFNYEYGNNYTHIDQSLPIEDRAHYYMSMDEKGLFCAKFIDGELSYDRNVQTSMMNGAPFHLWYFRNQAYGVEDLLIELYKNAKSCTNGDLKETADVTKREYSFTFSGTKFINGGADYYETEVSFSLAEDYSVKSVQAVQDYWENNSALAGRADYVPSFVTNSQTGITSPNTNYTYRIVSTATQTSGERTKTNPYSRDMYTFSSFDLVFDGQKLDDGDTIDCNVSDVQIEIAISNINPTTASFEQDPMYFSCDEGFEGEKDSSTLLTVTNGFIAWRDNYIIKVALKGGGVFTLRIRTSSGIEKTLKLNIIGHAPTAMSGQIGNTATEEFYFADKKTVAVGSSIYFYGLVNNAADARQTCKVTSDNADLATVQKATFGGKSCFKFSASTEGAYTVEVSSTSAPSVKCVFTFTISEIQDYENILKGCYTVTDYEGNIYLVEFFPLNFNGDFNGNVKITKTPTDEDFTPFPDEATEQTLEYYVDMDELTVNLSHALGENLGVKISVDVNGKLILEDRYGIEYQLNPVVE